MAIKKDIIDYNTAAVMSHHIISGISTDKLNDVTVITVTSFATINAYNAIPRKASLATEQIVLPGKIVPPEDNMWSWAYTQLTDPQNVAFNNITDKFVGGEAV